MKRILVFALALAGLAACNGNEDPPVSTDKVAIDPIIVGAAKSGFTSADQIGLTVIREDGETHAENELLTLSEGVFSSTLMWHTKTSVKSTLTAYYPYRSGGAPDSFSVAADQSSTGYAASDLLVAGRTGILPASVPVSMTFKPVMSRITINVVNRSGSDITSIVVKGSKTDATIDYTTQKATVTPASASADITANPVTKNTLYSAVLVPQTVELTVVVNVDGKSYEGEMTSRAYNAGETVSVGINVESGGGIALVEEFADHFVYAGERYNIVTFSDGTTWMADAMRYVPPGYTPASDPAEDSHIWYPCITDGDTGTALTDAASVTAKGYLYDNYVAFCSDITEANYNTFEGVQGICPYGWHIPTRMEWLDLVGTTNKNVGEDVAPENTNAIFWDTAAGSGSVPKADEKGFNYVFCGLRVKGSFTATGSYQKMVTTAESCPAEKYIGLPQMNYYMTSTSNKLNYHSTTEVWTGVNYFLVMSTFTKANNKGKLSIAIGHIENGQSIRCMKDTE